MTAVFTTYGASTADSGGTSVTAGVDTKGSWTEITSSTSADAKGIWVFFNSDDQNEPFAVDISTGSEGSEVVLLANLMMHDTRTINGGYSYYFPCDIASGARLAARAQKSDTGGAETFDVVIITSTESIPDVSSPSFETYGITLDASGPYSATIDPGASANTKGSWVEITSGAAADLERLCVQIDNQSNPTLFSGGFLIDIGIGSEGSEVAVVENILSSSDSAADLWFNFPIYLPGNAFQGARIAVRAQSTVTDSADRVFGISMYGTTGTAVTSGGGGGSVQLVNSNSLVS